MKYSLGPEIMVLAEETLEGFIRGGPQKQR